MRGQFFLLLLKPRGRAIKRKMIKNGSMRLISCLLFASVLALYADTIAGLKWTPPAGWKTDPAARPMRAATYLIPSSPGDKDTGECAVYFFGEGQGGGIQANLQRWQSQFQGVAGKPAVSKTDKRSVHGMTVTTIDVSGTYSGMGGGSPKPGYRMLGAIVEGPGGNVFFKFTGPEKTVTANQAKFDQMIASVAK